MICGWLKLGLFLQKRLREKAPFPEKSEVFVVLLLPLVRLCSPQDGVTGQSSIARRTTRTTSLGRRPVPCREPKLLTK